MKEMNPVEIAIAVLGFLLTLGAIFVLSSCASKPKSYDIEYQGDWQAERLEDAPKYVRDYYRQLSGQEPEPVFGL